VTSRVLPVFAAAAILLAGCAADPSDSSPGFPAAATEIGASADSLADSTGAPATADEHLDVAAATASFDAAEVIVKFLPGSTDARDGILVVQGIREAMKENAQDEDVYRCVEVSTGAAETSACPLKIDFSGDDTVSVTSVSWRVRYLTEEFSRSPGASLDDDALERAFSRTTKTVYPGIDVQWYPGSATPTDGTVRVHWKGGSVAACIRIEDAVVVAESCATRPAG
jgi:hypothetical protein